MIATDSEIATPINAAKLFSFEKTTLSTNSFSETSSISRNSERYRVGISSNRFFLGSVKGSSA